MSVTLRTGALYFKDASGEKTSVNVVADETFDTLEAELGNKLDAPSIVGESGQVLAIDGSGNTYWKTVSSGSSEGSGTSDYSELENKPTINGVVLDGNKSLADLGVVSVTDSRLSDARTPVTHKHKRSEITDFPSIPTETTVTNWGFTKNTGTYSKPAAGIPASDLAESYYLASNPNGYTSNTGTYSKPSDGIPKSDLSSAVQDSLNRADSAIQSHQTLPETLPNPYSITFTGAINDTYDGSRGIIVNIPTSSGNQTVNATWGSIAGTLTNQIDLKNALDAKGTYSKPQYGIPKSDLDNSVQSSLSKADSAVQTLPTSLPNPQALKFTGAVTGTYNGSTETTINIPTASSPTWGSIVGSLSSQTDLQLALDAKGTYSKPSTGIPATDLAESYYLASNPSGFGTYTKPNDGIPYTDLSDGVQDILDDVSTFVSSLEDKQDKLIAGSGISISSDGRTISATGTTAEFATVAEIKSYIGI